ncbi:hypothetical protein J6590_079619, partial [Homalodisca vitripennis]
VERSGLQVDCIESFILPPFHAVSESTQYLDLSVRRVISSATGVETPDQTSSGI